MWERRDKPLQVVQQNVTVPWELLDWRERTNSEQQADFEAFLLADRTRGFEVARPPLMRLILIQVAQDTYHFIWSRNHMVLDGWSSPLVLREVFAYYEAERHGKHLNLPRSRPYADYIGWLQQQDQKKAEIYWREALKGFTVATPLELTGQPWKKEVGLRPLWWSKYVCRRQRPMPCRSLPGVHE